MFEGLFQPMHLLIIAGRSRSGPLSLDHIAPIFLPSRQSTRPSLPRQVLSPDSRPPFMPGRTPVPRTSLTACGTTRLRLVAAGTVPPRLGRLRQAPFRGSEHALRYLGTYTHRDAISNSRLAALSEGNVTFRWRFRSRQQEAADDSARR
jgi:Putative transposase